MATPLGFEPRITPPKGAVLPLHHGVSRFAILDRRFSIKAQSTKVRQQRLHRVEGAPNDRSQIRGNSLYL